jgi:hypothetical protein
MATSKKRNEQTSQSVASKASKILSNPKSTPAQRRGLGLDASARQKQEVIGCQADNSAI